MQNEVLEQHWGGRKEVSGRSGWRSRTVRNNKPSMNEMLTFMPFLFCVSNARGCVTACRSNPGCKRKCKTFRRGKKDKEKTRCVEVCKPKLSPGSSGTSGTTSSSGSSGTSLTPVPASSPECVPNTNQKTVFVTSSKYNGNFHGIAGADAYCQGIADNSPLVTGCTFQAWLADSTTSPAGSTTPWTTTASFAQSTVPYKLVDGTTVANDWTELTSGTLQNPINVDETGSVPFASTATQEGVWTGTNADGTPICAGPSSSCNCLDWGFAWLGNSDGGISDANSNSPFTNWDISDCTFEFPIYCFEK